MGVVLVRLACFRSWTYRPGTGSVVYCMWSAFFCGRSWSLAALQKIGVFPPITVLGVVVLLVELGTAVCGFVRFA